MKIHIEHTHFHHVVRDPETARFESLVLRILQDITEAQNKMAKTLDDLIQQANDTLAAVTKNTDLEGSIIALQKASAQQIKDLKDQLAAAGTDPAKLQTLSDTMDALAAKVAAEGQAAADAVTANTPAQ